MRGLFAALTKLTVADHFGFSGNVLGKYPNNRSTNCRLFVEKARGSLFDLFSQSEKLLHARGAFCSLRSSEFIKRGIADLTHENLVVVQHGKPESVSFLVMPLDFVTDQRHGPHSPQTGAGSQRMPRPASQINGFTATLSRKLLTFLIALASIAFGVCSPAHADCVAIPGLPQSGTGCAYSYPPSSGPFSLTYESDATSSATTPTVSYGTLTWGSGCNTLVLPVQWYNTNLTDSISSIAISGNSAPAQISGVQVTNNNGNVTSDAWELVAPSGTSGTASVTYSAAPTFTSVIGAYCLVSAHTTATATAHNSGFGTTVSQSVVVPSGGAALIVASASGGSTISLTNGTIDTVVTTGGVYMVFGHTTATGTVSVTATTGTNDNLTLGLAAWGP
jgi:hypothetical protein